jgi:hypothetical protein
LNACGDLIAGTARTELQHLQLRREPPTASCAPPAAFCALARLLLSESMKHSNRSLDNDSQTLEAAIFIATVGAMLCSVFVLSITLT